MHKKTLDTLLSETSFEITENRGNEAKAEKAVKKARKSAKRKKGDFSVSKKQKEFLKSFKKKYGSEAVNELVKFRNETSAPLHQIQKKTREAGFVTTKDLMSVTKKEWERAVESGRNKISRRGELFNKIKKDIGAIEHNRKSIEKLERIKRMLSGNAPLDKNLVRGEIDRFIKNHNFISADKLDSLQELQQYVNDIEKSWATLKREMSKEEKNIDLDAISDEAENILEKQYGVRKYKKDNKKKGYDEELSKAAVSYFFRQNIINSILSSGDNVFKTFYYSFLNKLTKDASKRINQHNETLRRRGSDLDFTDAEKKVWGVNKNAHPMSGNANDYYLKIEAEDFENKGETKTIEQPDDMKQAKKNIENERYNFVQRLKKKYDISDEDYHNIQNLNILSFMDKEKLYKYAQSKLSGKFGESEIKREFEQIYKDSSSDKEAKNKIDELSRFTINRDSMYNKAYRMFSSELNRAETKSLVDSIIKKSKTEEQVEKRLLNNLEELKKSKKGDRRFVGSVLGKDEKDEDEDDSDE